MNYSNIYISSNPIFLLHCLKHSKLNTNKKYLIIDKETNLGGAWRVFNKEKKILFDKVHFIFLEDTEIDKKMFIEEFNNLLKIIDNDYILNEENSKSLILPDISTVNKMSFFDTNININILIANLIKKIQDQNNIHIKEMNVISIDYITKKYKLLYLILNLYYMYFW